MLHARHSLRPSAPAAGASSSPQGSLGQRCQPTASSIGCTHDRPLLCSRAASTGASRARRAPGRTAPEPRLVPLQAVPDAASPGPDSDEQSQSAEERQQPGASTSGRSAASQPEMSRQMMAAMALSPLAALALPLVNDGRWQDAASGAVEGLRARMQSTLHSDGFQKWTGKLDNDLTFMEWTWKWLGVDVSYVWDAELWVRFKEAVWNDQPHLFWNKLLERIEYRIQVPQAGMAGDMRISYAKFLNLLEANRIKRIVVFGDMKTAVVEVPHPWTASMSGAPGAYPFFTDNQGAPLTVLTPNALQPDNPAQWYCPEMPEWDMEKYRFYVDLPGDFWEGGQLMRYLREREVRIEWDPELREYIMPHRYMTRNTEVRTELQVLDPQDSWDFMAWLMQPAKMQFYEKSAAVCLFVRFICIALTALTGTKIYSNMQKKKEKKDNKKDVWQKLTRSKAREFMSKDKKTGKMRDTGVRFEDIAGLDFLVDEMKEVVKLLLKDPAYMKVGAKCPRGIILQGPPGTGKTYLARALAGEAGVPFFSCAGSEFVEMYAGVAAARVNNLFETARQRAPCIIFIDEIDAIGKARSSTGNDAGSQERESALLAMLVAMDGIHTSTEQVLTIGATNMAPQLDQALLRPGRFEVIYEINNPGPAARMSIMKYHSKNKPLSNPAILMEVAQVTQGWSAASLANLMNEAAIVTVRRNAENITLPMMLELIELSNTGPRLGKIPASVAKNRLALVTAAKAVALALTPGVDVIDHVTLWSGRPGLGPYIDFRKSADNLLDPSWHPQHMEQATFSSNVKVNACVTGEAMGEFLHTALLILPLYAPRAAELSLFGPDGASLATAGPLSDGFELAYYCVRNSMLHPRFRRMPPLHTSMWLGFDAKGRNQRDPLALGLDDELGYHTLVVTLLKAAWRRACVMVAERQTAIVRVAEAMLNNPDERILGAELVSIIEQTPLDEVDADVAPVESDFLPLLKGVMGEIPGVVLEGAAAVAAAEAAHAAAAALAANAGGMLPGLEASFRGHSRRAGVCGQVSMQPRRRVGPSLAASFHSNTCGGAGRPGQVVMQPRGAPPPAPPSLRLSDETLRAVSRTIMGRLDIVDLIGKNTAAEVAERVRAALLDPATTERLSAVRRWVDTPGGAFPPAPLAADVPQPAYGVTSMDLEVWKQRRIGDPSWSALNMLYTDKQIEYYRADGNMPRYADTTLGRQRQADAQAADASSKQ